MNGKTMDVWLQSPFTAVVTGPTGSGKTVFISRLIKTSQTVATSLPVEIIYRYGVWQDAYDCMEGVRWHKGMIDLSSIECDGRNRWLITDDLMDELAGSKTLNDLFTMHSHHYNLSVFMVLKKRFSNKLRTVSTSTQYFLMAKNPRDVGIFGNLAKQMLPGQCPYAKEAFADATRKPHSLLRTDLRQATDDNLRLIGNFCSGSPDLPMTPCVPRI